jgi:sugar phosphate isomerase/epimerase
MEVVGGSLLLAQRPLGEALAKLAALGFREVELGVQDWCDLKPTNLIRHFERELDRTQTALSQHGLAPVALNAAIGEGPTERMQAVLRFAEALGVRHVTIQALTEA